MDQSINQSGRQAGRQGSRQSSVDGRLYMAAAEHSRAQHQTRPDRTRAYHSTPTPPPPPPPPPLHSTPDTGWLACLCLSSLCRSRHFAYTQPIGSLAPLNLHAASLHPPNFVSKHHYARSSPVHSCGLCVCCVREPASAAGIPPQLSGRLLCSAWLVAATCASYHFHPSCSTI